MHATLRDLLLALTLALGLAPLPAAAAETVVTLGSAQNSVGSLALVVAQQRGLFAAEGLKVETLDFKGGGPAVQALAGGSIDFCVCAADHALRLTGRGLPAEVAVALSQRHGYAVLSLASSPAGDLQGLKGKKIGITSAGSLTDNTIRHSLREAGLDPDTDVELISIGTGVPMKAALDNGLVAAGMFTTPDVQANLAEAGKYKVVQDYRGTPYPSLGLLALKSWLEKNGGTAKAFGRAVVKAQQLIQADPTAIRVAIKQMFPRFDGQLAEAVAVEATRSLATDGIVEEEGFKTMLAVVGQSEPALREIAYGSVVSKTYVTTD